MAVDVAESDSDVEDPGPTARMGVGKQYTFGWHLLQHGGDSIKAELRQMRSKFRRCVWRTHAGEQRPRQRPDV